MFTIKYIIILLTLSFFNNCNHQDDLLFFEKKTALGIHRFYKNGWLDTVRIMSIPEAAKVRYVNDLDNNKLFVLDGWVYFYKIDAQDGRLLKKVKGYGQNGYHSKQNELVHWSPYLVHYTGLGINVYNYNLDTVKSLTNYLKRESGKSKIPCDRNYTRTIDTILVTKHEMTIMLNYCDITQDTLKLDKDFCLKKATNM